MDGPKRKRDDDGTVVTFYVPDRTFARVYKGQSLEETKALVRKKLGISEDTSLRFARLHEGKVIELDDDEDFEAFRHLARHVPMLDVSVFVGQSGPSLFSGQTSGEPSANPNTSKRHNKTRRAMPPTSVVSSEATTRGAMLRKEQMSGAPDTGTSTLDANGVPKKKRKRKGMSPQSELAVSSLVHPPTAPQSASEGYEPSITLKRNLKPPIPATLSAVSSLTASQATVLFPTEVPGPSKGSKRKRQDTPESPVVPGRAAPVMTSSSITSQPSSPSSLAKKRRKEKRSEDAASVITIEKQTIARPDKKGKRKADDTVSTSTPPEAALVLADDPDDTVAAKKAAKRAKRDAKAKERQATETREQIASSKEDGKRGRKHKTKDAEEAHMTDGTSIEPLVSHIPSEVELAPKKGKGKERVETATEPQIVPLDVPIPVASTSDGPPKSGKERKSKAKTCRAEQLATPPMKDTGGTEATASSLVGAEAEVEEEQTGKKSKRGKTLSTASQVDVEGTAAPADNPSHVASTEGIAVPSVHDGSTSASVKKSKGDLKMSLPAGASSSDTAETAPTTGMSVVQAAFEAVLARASSTSAGPVPVSPSHEPTPLTAELSIPARKRKAAKSKLSQAWGPNDLAGEQEQASVSATVSATVPAPTSLAPETPTAPAPKTKRTKSKKPPRPSSAPTCLICDKASLHPRSQCSIVVAGPVAIRKRIAEMKKCGHSELVEELEVLLKEAQRRRKSAGSKRAVEVTVPVWNPALDVSARGTPSSLDLPLRSISTSSQLRLPLSDRSLSSPRVPAGSEVSEVAVQSRDEGSSNESSSDDEDGNEGAPASSFSSLSLSLHLPDPDNLEALLYGPVKARPSILAQIPSSSESSSSSEESDDEAEKGEDVDMDEDEKNDRAFRRMSRKFARAASSSDEDEPQPEPDQVQDLDAAEADESLVLPPEVHLDSNSSLDMQDAQQVEADVLAQNTHAVERSVGQSEEVSHAVLHDADSSEGEDQAESRPHTQSKAESDEEAQSKPVPSLDNQSSESEVDERDASPADRGDDHRVEPGAEVDPLASQEHLEVSIEVSEQSERSEGGVDVDEEPKQHSAEVDEAEVSIEVSKLSRGPEPKLQVDLPQDRVSNGDDLNAGGFPVEASPDLSGTTAQVELEKVAIPFGHRDEVEGVAQGNQDTVEVEVIEPHTEDPDDPIDTFSSDHDQEHRDVLDEDPIEDPDMTKERQRTPPPATPRTPGTVRRMKDRYGRVSQARGHRENPRLSQQLLGDLVLSQEEITLGSPLLGALESSLDLETAPNMQMEAETGEKAEKEEEVVEPAKTHEETALSQSQSQSGQTEGSIEARPRRTTRTTVRRSSSTVPSSSLPELQVTPTPAPAQRRHGSRLTAEEKAQREAEKAQKNAEKKAERERKAAEKAAKKAAKEVEKKAERERKAAERQAEKEAKQAEKEAKQAEKEAKQAEKQAKQKEKAPVKRGRAPRGRGGSTKPISTRSQRAMESVEPDEEGVDERTPSGENAEMAFITNVTETPGVAKVSWAVLPQSELRTQEGSVGETSMVDELQPSSPETAPHHALVEDIITKEPIAGQENLPTVTPKPKSNKNDPLFIPSSSQHPLTPFGLPNAESTPFGDDDRQDDDEHDPDAEPDTTFKAPTRPRASWASQSLYPSLTDLASQSLFSTTQIPSPALFSQGTSYKLSSATYDKTKGDDDDDDDDESSYDSNSSDSDSDKKKSHIPQNRRAGAGVQKSKKSGLLSVYG